VDSGFESFVPSRKWSWMNIVISIGKSCLIDLGFAGEFMCLLLSFCADFIPLVSLDSMVIQTNALQEESTGRGMFDVCRQVR
jgi:hypothetical protein